MTTQAPNKLGRPPKHGGGRVAVMSRMPEPVAAAVREHAARAGQPMSEYVAHVMSLVLTGEPLITESTERQEALDGIAPDVSGQTSTAELTQIGLRVAGIKEPTIMRKAG